MLHDERPNHSPDIRQPQRAPALNGERTTHLNCPRCGLDDQAQGKLVDDRALPAMHRT